MKNSKFRKIVLIVIIGLSVILRFWRLNDVPAGFHQDEVSQAYNAYAIATTGADRYGEALPVLFRSFGSYQPSVYTYLSTVPIKLFGNTVFAARFLSAICGVGIVLLGYLLIVNLVNSKNKYLFGILTSFVLSISPWAIHFSRRVVEGNTGLFFFMLALYFFVKSLKQIGYFYIAVLILGLATHAYYSERLIAVLFLPLFLFANREYFFRNKKQVILGSVIFALTIIPHLWILATGAFARRFDQVSYFADNPNGLPKIVFIGIEFIKHFLSYISPKNLFADTGSDLARVSPDLGVFFEWMFLPFILGVYNLIKTNENDLKKMLIILIPISLVPASLTGDIFYPLRALVFLFLISVVVANGIVFLNEKYVNQKIKSILFLVVMLVSMFNFYISYFVLFQYETTEYVGESYIKLNEYFKKYPDKNFVIDSARDLAIGLRIAYFTYYPAHELAKQLRPQLTSNYYSSEVGIAEVYKINNILVRPIKWEIDRCSKNTILIGDELAFSDDQLKEHKLTPEFEVKGNDGRVILKAYHTHPDIRCK